MGSVEVVLNLILLIYFIYSMIKALKIGAIMDSIIIACMFPTLVSIIGVESFRTLGYLILLFTCGVFLLKDNPSLQINLFKQKKYYIITFIVFVFLFCVNTVYSNAAGGAYYFQKLVGTVLFIFIPVVMILLCKV